MDLEEQIREGIEKYNKQCIRIFNEQNEQLKQEMKETLEFLKEKAGKQKGSIDLSKLKPSKYPICYDCWFDKIRGEINERYFV